MSVTDEFLKPTGSVLDEALAACNAGMSVARVMTNGEKRPLGEWKDLQSQRATREQVQAWFGLGHPGVGVICGAVSGGLEMFEFEGPAVEEGMFEEFERRIDDAGLADLWQRISEGWREVTPAGGTHVYWRCPPDSNGQYAGNTKLAKRSTTETLIETRGEGGFSVIAPSHGPVHPNGMSWTRFSGGPATIATITHEEREAIFAIARTFDTAHPPKTITEQVATSLPNIPRVEMPGGSLQAVDGTWDPAKYPVHTNQQGWMDGAEWWVNVVAFTWHDVLPRYGWTFCPEQGADDIEYWTRPDKDVSKGKSASTNAKGTDRLLVFSPNTPFECFEGGGKLTTTYDKVDVVATYEYGGDRKAALKALCPRIHQAWVEEKDRKYQEFLAAAVGRPIASPVTSPPAATDAVQEPEPPTPQPQPPAEAPPTPGDQPVAEVAEQPTEPASIDRLCTDFGNAERLLDHHGEELRYFTAQGDWLLWDGQRWAVDEMLKHRYLASCVARSILNEAGRQADSDKRRELARWSASSESAGRISAMLTLYQPLAAVLTIAEYVRRAVRSAVDHDAAADAAAA